MFLLFCTCIKFHAKWTPHSIVWQKIFGIKIGTFFSNSKSGFDYFDTSHCSDLMLIIIVQLIVDNPLSFVTQLFSDRTIARS